MPMRCPNCGDEYEPGVARCADCGVPLIDPDSDVEPVVPPALVDTRLGRFHPAVGDVIGGVLERRAIPHLLRPTDDEVEVLVEREWRDDLRAEFAVSWNELLRGLDEQRSEEVRTLGGSAPGWFDAPRGGYVDRAGRMVVVGDEDDDEADQARMIGPALLTMGAITIVVGWLVVSSPGLVIAGIAMAIAGVFTPR
jgi:hypothetical protein